MLIGIPREIKDCESRVSLTPAAVAELTRDGASVLVERDAGKAVGCSNEDYEREGAAIAEDAGEVYSRAELIVKVKEPQPSEYKLFHKDQTLFSYLHLAVDRPQTEALMESGVTAIAYETVADSDGYLPLLVPMSQIAGRLATQVGAHYLQKTAGGCGVLLSGIPGVAPASVVVLGSGTSGTEAARIAAGMGADLTILDLSLKRLCYLEGLFGRNVRLLYATRDAVTKAMRGAHLVIGAVLIPGASAPKVADMSDIASMAEGAVAVDIAIDQGGCLETSRPATHGNPVFVREGVLHYCVTNMPAAVARTSTQALSNAVLPFVQLLARKGVEAALAEHPDIKAGVNVQSGRIVHEAVAKSLNIPQ